LPELRKLQGGFGIKSNNVPTALESKDITIPVGNGSIAVRVYTPSANPGALPLCVVYHGGGWTIGDLDTEDGIPPSWQANPVFCRFICAEGPAIVVSADYRLYCLARVFNSRSPEYPFPTPFDDCFDTYRWVRLS
jgi:acetyl esterase